MDSSRRKGTRLIATAVASLLVASLRESSLLITGLLLVQSGWSLRSRNSFGWIMVIAGVLSAVAAVIMVFNIGTGAVGISTLLGLQVLLTGIALVLLSFAKKVVAGRVKDRIESLR